MLMKMLLDEALKNGYEPEQIIRHILASQALPGIIAQGDTISDDTIEQDVEIAYQYADEMLKHIRNDREN